MVSVNGEQVARSSAATADLYKDVTMLVITTIDISMFKRLKVTSIL